MMNGLGSTNKALRRDRSTVAAVVVSLLVIALSVGCVLVAMETSELRRELSTRVRWLEQLQELQAARRDFAANRGVVVMQEQALGRLAAEILTTPRVTPQLRAVTPTMEQVEQDPLEHISRLVPAIRSETSTLSAQLFDQWSAMFWICGGALGLAACALILFAYVRVRVGGQSDPGLGEYRRSVDRLSTIGVLAAGVAHRLSNPLTYIQGNLQLLQDGSLDDDERDELTREVFGGVQRLVRLVQSLRSAAPVPHHDSSPCEVKECIEAALEAQTRHRTHVARVVRRYSHVPSVWGSKERLEQLFNNILLNSLHALDDREHAELNIEVQRKTPTIVEVRIHDNGPGVPDSVIANVFEPFVTTKREEQGMGLGLFICDNIAKSFMGKVSLSSSDSGTTVTVSLPVIDHGLPSVPTQWMPSAASVMIRSRREP